MSPQSRWLFQEAACDYCIIPTSQSTLGFSIPVTLTSRGSPPRKSLLIIVVLTSKRVKSYKISCFSKDFSVFCRFKLLLIFSLSSLNMGCDSRLSLSHHDCLRTGLLFKQHARSDAVVISHMFWYKFIKLLNSFFAYEEFRTTEQNIKSLSHQED